MVSNSAPRRLRFGLLAITGASAAAALTACSSSSPADEAPASHESAAAQPGTSPETLKDGDYTAEGGYTSPGGAEKISVKVTLAGGVVSALMVKSDAANDPTAKQYESQFIGGVNALVVGKKLAGLSVSRVAGSSLTSMGFDDAIAKIQAQARG